jgi:DNA/RNA endonuclease G (NUC1)
MRTKGLVRFSTGLALLIGGFASAQSVRLSELHYDNTGTDVGEAIEISGPVGLDLTGWSVLLYNGSGGGIYDTRLLSGPIPATCGNRGVVVLNFPENGLQNGSPDGVALVNAGGTVVEFLSYEGSLLATEGAANGLTSTDIGVSETNFRPLTSSLARQPAGGWLLTSSSTFGACNDHDPSAPAEVVSVSVSPASATVPAGATVLLAANGADGLGQPAETTFSWSSSAPGVASVSGTGLVTGLQPGNATITATSANGVSGSASIVVEEAPPTGPPPRFNEIHYDNAGTDAGEAIEIEGEAGTDLAGYSIVLYNGNAGAAYATVPLSGVLGAVCDTRGLHVVDFPENGIQNGSPDGMALVAPDGSVIEFLSYEGTFAAVGGPADGMLSTDIGASQNNAVAGTSLQRTSSGVWRANFSSFGACNADSAGGFSVNISGRTSGDVPLPVGFQDQLFARLVDANNQTLASTFVWTSDTPAIASIEQNGVMTALAEGSATLRATAEDGTFGTITLPTRVAVASTTALYGNNAEFGEPADGDASDDYIVRYPQYTASYNALRGTPNWVSYNLEATHFGDEDRCDCFTMDPALPASFPQLTTADYTDAGAFHGYGIDRGHLARSFDRTSGGLDNAYTYLFDNIVPQAADLNQGPWAVLENFLGDEARLDNREVYIVTGVAGNKGTLKNEGRVVIPASTWKVAVLLPRDQGLAHLRDYRDLEVIAVDMPNEPGVRNVDWSTYLTTVDAIEAATGYDLLAALPDDIEAAVEGNLQPPLAALTGTTTLSEGGSASFDASASVDPNGSIVSHAWNFGDGSTGEGANVTHVYAQDGEYTVTVTITDDDGLTDTASLTVVVSNVAPVLAAIADATLAAGDAYTVSGTFSDPGADAWTATVDWGDGSSPSQAIVTGHEFSLVHVYETGGTYSVTVSLADDDATASGAHTVTVTSVEEPGVDLSPALGLIDQLVAARKISRDFGNLMKSQVRSAQTYADQDKYCAAVMMLQTVQMEVDLLVRFRQITTTDAAPLRAFLQQAIVELNQAKAAAEAAARAAKAAKAKSRHQAAHKHRWR